MTDLASAMAAPPGYIATLALFSVAPEAFKPTALVLNIVVSAIASYSFACAGRTQLLHWSTGGAHSMVTPCFFESGDCFFRTPSPASLFGNSLDLISDNGTGILR